MASIVSSRLPERPEPHQLAPAIQDQYIKSNGQHISDRLAVEVAICGFASTTRTMDTARNHRLICVNLETIYEARQKGLLK